MMARSSSCVHLCLRTSGERWLCQRSRHCLPERPSILSPIIDQRTFEPHSAISSRSFRSSAVVQTCFFHAPWWPSSSSLSPERFSLEGEGSPEGGVLSFFEPGTAIASTCPGRGPSWDWAAAAAMAACAALRPSAAPTWTAVVVGMCAKGVTE